jgi:hypothetical protein
VWLVATASVVVLLATASWQWSHRGAVDPLPVRRVAPTIRSQAPSSTQDTEAVRVEVLNGCGAPQIAARLTRRARELGLDVIDQGNAETFAFRESMVIDRSGNMDRASAVANLLGIPICVQQITHDPSVLAEVSVIIGRDYEKLALLAP